MRSKDDPLTELRELSQSMVQGSLSEVTRQCGDPSCACAHDPARRHGPHLYLKFSDQGNVRSVYVPAALAGAIRQAHQAWIRFQALATELAARNRSQILRELERDKVRARRERAQR